MSRGEGRGERGEEKGERGGGEGREEIQTFRKCDSAIVEAGSDEGDVLHRGGEAEERIVEAVSQGEVREADGEPVE